MATISDDHQQDVRSERIPTMAQNCSFPRKVHALLQYAQTNDLERVVCWIADGKGFHVVNPNAFMEEIAPHFFPNHSSFRSFERMLNLWGFKRERAPPPQKIFWNSNFQRDKPELCRNMSRNENKGTKQQVPVSGMERIIQVRNSIPSWAKEHQEAALQYFSAQSAPKNLAKAQNSGCFLDSQEEQQVVSQLQSVETNRLCGQTEEEDRYQRDAAGPKVNREALGRPESVRLEQISRDSSYEQHNECTVALASCEQISSDVNSASSLRELRVEEENHITSKSKEMIPEESGDVGYNSFVDKGQRLRTLLQSDSACFKKQFPEGQFDDAPDSLLVLASVAVSDSTKDDSSNKQELGKGS